MLSFFSLTRDALTDELDARCHDPAGEAQRLFGAVYREGARAWSEVARMPHRVRRWLAQEVSLQGVQLKSETGGPRDTRHLTYELGDGARVGLVLVPQALSPGAGGGWVATGLRRLLRRGSGVMPSEDSVAACLCSEVGCHLACRSPATAEQALQRPLHTAELVSLVVAARRVAPVLSVVLMGRQPRLADRHERELATRILTDPSGCGYSPDRIALSPCGI